MIYALLSVTMWRAVVFVLSYLPILAISFFIGRAPESMSLHDPNGAPEEIAYDVIHAIDIRQFDTAWGRISFNPGLSLPFQVNGLAYPPDEGGYEPQGDPRPYIGLQPGCAVDQKRTPEVKEVEPGRRWMVTMPLDCPQDWIELEVLQFGTAYKKVVLRADGDA